MRNALTVLAGVGVLVTMGVACSEVYCPFGLLPFDGATGVAADTVVTFQSETPFSPDVPALRDAFYLVDVETGVDVPFTVSVSRDRQTVTLTPTEPLEAGHAYQTFGPSAPDTWQLHYFEGFPNHAVGSTFTVGGDPHVIYTVVDGRDLYVVWSEVADVAPPEVQVLNSGSWETIRDLPDPQPLADAPSITRVELPVHTDATPVRVILPDGGVETPSSLVAAFGSLDDLARRFNGTPYCDYGY